jgi:hypothetical protein
VKLSLISATSVIALLSSGIDPARAAALSPWPVQSNIYDLVQDGVTSAEGGDQTVTRQDPLVLAALALEASTNGLQAIGFTGRPDSAIALGNAYPAIPLGAAAGTRPADGLVLEVPTTGNLQWDAMLKARAVGAERMASLIGSIGIGQPDKDKSSGTVFMAAASPAGFNDGGDPDGAGTSSVVAAYAPSSTSSATITVAGNLSRQNNNLAVVAANSLQRMTPGAVDAPVLLSDATQPTRGFVYAPISNPEAKLIALPASFSDAATANGVRIADWKSPSAIQTSEAAVVQGVTRNSDVSRMVRVQTSEVGPDLARSPDRVSANLVAAGATQVDGTRRFMSVSVSANPTASAALYMANVVSAAPTSPIGQATTVEAFQIGPRTNATAPTLAVSTVSQPLGGKIFASAGPLNSNLALP